MHRRLSSLLLVSGLIAIPLFHTGCGPQTAMPFTAEADDPDYRRGKELLRMGREKEALSIFLKLIDERGGAAAESHLEAGILYQRYIKEPIFAIYHYRRYRELRPNSEQSRLVMQSIEACIREFARTLPAQPMDNQEDRTVLIDAIDRLQRENMQLKEQLVGARAAVLDNSRQSAAGARGAADGGPYPSAVGEPSQGYAVDETTGLAPEYSAPVGVVPVPNPTAPTPAPVPPPTPQPGMPAATTRPPQPAPTRPIPGGYRKHTVSQGDTLMSISLRYYGNRSRWREIFAVNRDVLPSETALKIGMELKIPQ